MPKRTTRKTLNFDEKTRQLVVKRQIQEIYNKQELYNIYKNLQQQLKQFETQVMRIKKDLIELEPHFRRIEEEVEKEIK